MKPGPRERERKKEKKRGSTRPVADHRCSLFCFFIRSRSPSYSVADAARRIIVMLGILAKIMLSAEDRTLVSVHPPAPNRKVPGKRPCSYSSSAFQRKNVLSESMARCRRRMCRMQGSVYGPHPVARSEHLKDTRQRALTRASLYWVQTCRVIRRIEMVKKRRGSYSLPLPYQCWDAI